METIIDKYNRRSNRPGAPQDKSPDVAFFAGNNRRGGKLNRDRDTKCFNYHKKVHNQPNC